MAIHANRMKSKFKRVEINFDSLMDILTSVVGVIVIIVLFTVITAKGKMVSKNVAVRVNAPFLRKPPPNLTSKVFICQSGKIYYYGVGEAFEKMKEGVKVNNISDLASTVNEKNIQDEDFFYKLLVYTSGTPMVIIKVDMKKEGGDWMENLLKVDGMYLTRLDSFNKYQHWIHFLVDGQSLEVFDLAKRIAEQEGFFVGWEPLKMVFPHRECLEGCPSGATSTVEIIRGINL